MLLDLVLVFLAAAGLILMVWCFFGFLLRPVFGSDMVTFLTVSGCGDNLEQQIRAFAWLRDGKLSGGRLVVLDRGLDLEGQQIVRLLCETYDWLEYCCPSEAGSYILK